MAEHKEEEHPWSSLHCFAVAATITLLYSGEMNNLQINVHDSVCWCTVPDHNSRAVRSAKSPPPTEVVRTVCCLLQALWSLTLSLPAVQNAMSLWVPGVPASCEKFPHTADNFWPTELICNQFLCVFLRALNALCVCLHYKHPRLINQFWWVNKCSFLCDFVPKKRLWWSA
jgi:hypothetical protein